jgi:segregation and condensation protein A
MQHNPGHAPVKPQLELDNYSGPLELLLGLIEQQRLDITAISLAQVAEQYMAAVAALAQPDPDTIAEFLVIGAKLLVIKTRALLPRPPAELASSDEEDAGEQLARQLREYQRYKQAAGQLRAWEQAGLRAYARLGAPPLPPPRPIETKLDVSLAELAATMQRRLQLLLPLADEPVGVPLPKIITIADVRTRLLTTLRRQRWTSFEDLLSLALTRNEVIVTLWTVLELFKRQAIVFEQQALFGVISISHGPAFDAFVQQAESPAAGSNDWELATGDSNDAAAD